MNGEDKIRSGFDAVSEVGSADCSLRWRRKQEMKDLVAKKRKHGNKEGNAHKIFHKGVLGILPQGNGGDSRAA